MNEKTVTHLFAGGGGDVRGWHQAGCTPIVAINHDGPAVDTLRANFPDCHTRQADINNLDMRSLPATRYLVGSPICTEVSPAGGQAAPRTQDSLLDGDTGSRTPDAQWSRTRATAWDLIRAAEVHRYDVIAWENVPRFATAWPLFPVWLQAFTVLGYDVHLASVDAAHLGVPQHRHRVLGAFVRRGGRVDLRVRPDALCAACGPVVGVQQWAAGRRVGRYGQQYRYVCPNRACGHRPVEPVTVPVSGAIEWDVPGRPFHLGKARRRERAPYEPSTRAKVEAGLRQYDGAPFIAVLRKNCTTQPLDGPIGAITAAGNHHMLVRPTVSGTVDDCEVRMLTSREKARCQGFPDDHVLCGSDSAQGRQVGNAVPVPGARWLAERLTTAA